MYTIADYYRDEGREEGREERDRQLALRLFEKKFPPELIKELTNIDVQQIGIEALCTQ